jgi:hypothetical protein
MTTPYMLLSNADELPVNILTANVLPDSILAVNCPL